MATRTAEVLLQPLPSVAEAEAQLAEAQATLSQLEAEGASTVKTVPQQLVARWARGVLQKVKDGITQETISYPLIGYRIDDFVLLGMPGEPFVEIQLAAKQRSKATHTMFAGYANGIRAYLPTAETVRQGGSRRRD